MTGFQRTVTKTQIMIHGPENSLFLQIQNGTHKFKQSWWQQWVLLHCHCRELKYQIPGRPARLKVWSISRAKAQPSTNGLSWDSKRRRRNVALGSRMHKNFPAKHFPPPNLKLKLSLCLYSQKCLDCFNWHLPRKEKKKKTLKKTLATSKFSLSGQSLADRSNWKKSEKSIGLHEKTAIGASTYHYCSSGSERHVNTYSYSQPYCHIRVKKQRDESKGVLADTGRICGL